MAQYTNYTPVRLAMMLALLAAVYPASAYSAAAAEVAFATAGVTATGADGIPRPLSKGASVDAGDMIQTTAGRAQLRFSDGGIVSLQPNTEFRIDEYHYEGKTDGSEKGFFSLVKGGLRAITGAIGHVNKRNYQVNTAVATIGIRGTEFLALLNDTLEMTCGEGICVLFNEGGELVLYAGESGKAKNRKTAPESDPEKPMLPPEQNLPDPTFDFYSASEDRDVNGNPCSITGCAAPGQILPNGSGYVAAFVDSGVGVGGPNFDTGFSAVFNGSGQLTSMNNGYYYFDKTASAVTISSGNDGIIAWGRWLGNASACADCTPPSPTAFGPNDGWSYVVGIPTSSMPATGTATYSMIGATLASSPTLGNGTFNGALNVDFGSGWLNARLNVNFAAGSAGFSSNAYFGGSSSFQGGSSSTTGSLCGGNGCTAFYRGFFAGADAARAGMAYQITTGANDSISGTAAFTKSGPGTPIPLFAP